MFVEAEVAHPWRVLVLAYVERPCTELMVAYGGHPFRVLAIA